MKTLVIGCGYVGMALSKKLASEENQVYALRRSRWPSAVERDSPIIPIVADIIQKESLEQIKPDFDWVVFCASAGNQSYQELYYQGTLNVLEWLRNHPPKKYVYTSSTGVYTQSDGSWVTEKSPREPLTPNSQALKDTEDLLIQANRERSFPSVILRAAGIYGPNRGYWLNKFLSGEAISNDDNHRYINMIHLEDLVGSIMKSLTHASGGEVFNVVDSEPVTPSIIYQWLSTILKHTAKEAPVDSRATKRNPLHKRVSNEKLRVQLGYQLIYPTFREGFAHEMKRMNGVGEVNK